MRTGSDLQAIARRGQFLRRLGFRWVFPIGTLPIPYHPLIGLAFLIGPPLWIAWLAVSALSRGGAIPWWQPLVVALALGLPMSVPFVSWALLVFRAPLAQGVLIAGAMLLLALDVAAARAPLVWAVLPAGFVALYLVQRLGGMVQLARLKREAAAWTPIDPGDETVVLTDATIDRAREFVTRCDIVRVAAGERVAHWLAPSAVAALREACGGVPPPGWTLPWPDTPPVVTSPAGTVAGGLVVTISAYRPRLVRGELHRVEVRGDFGTRTVVMGKAQIVGWLPLFTAFHWTAIVGQSSWHLGFAPDRPVPLGAAGDDYRRIWNIFASRPAEGGRREDASPLLDRIATDAAADRARIDDLWRTIADTPAARLESEPLRRLSTEPGLFGAGDGQRLAAWLAAAKAGRAPVAVKNAAYLLTRLPDALFAAARAELFAVLDSRILAGEWRIEPGLDLSDVPRNCPRFGHVAGFGLMRSQARLYDRLSALGEAEAELVEKLRTSLKR